MSEKYSAVLHKRHGWIEAGKGNYFTPSKTGKSIEFHEPNPPSDPALRHFYPFGTTFHATSIYAMEELDEA